MRWTTALAGAMLGLTLASGAAAQENYPNQIVRIIVPFTPGGIVDVIARLVGEKLSARLGQPVVVENKVGAGGAIGTDHVAKAPPDGYTLLTVSPGHAVLPSVNKSITWDPVRDFRAIVGVGVVPNVIVVPAEQPFRSVPELLARAKAEPGTVTYGTAGVGTSNHLSGELLAQMAGVQLTHIPYKGQPEAVNDLLANRLTMMSLTTALAAPHIKSARLRGLAVTTAKRSTSMPELPTVAEAASLPGYDVGTWFGFVAPAKVPDAIVRRLADDMTAVLALPEVKDRLTGLGMDVAPQTPEQFDKYVAAEHAKWAKVVAQAGITAQ